MRRVLSLILVIIMAASVFGSVIYYLAISLSADNKYKGYGAEDFLMELEKMENNKKSDTETDSEDGEVEGTDDSEGAETDSDGRENGESKTDAVEEAADAKDVSSEAGSANTGDDGVLSDDKLIRVGLMYGTGVTQGFEVTTPYGFVVNRVLRSGDLTSEPIWVLDIEKISCIIDHNLSKSGMTYSKTDSSSATVIGAYHAEIETNLTREQVLAVIETVTPTLEALGVYPIPAYVDGGFSVRAGHFATADKAEALAEKIRAEHPEFAVGIATPTDTAVSVVDPMTDTLLFEYDDRDVTAIGFTPLSSPEGEKAYLVTPAKKLYDGTFMFRRYISGSTDGVSLTDIIPLGEYIKGVLPYEISSSWPIEAQKAFAICVRSYTLAGVRHESTYQVDLCNTTHCQVYNGRTRVTDVVEQAVDETDGLVMSYNGKIVTAYYSAVTGGVTVNVEDAWGGKSQPYLVAVKTPWENFTSHSEGVWQTEVSGKELCSYLSGTKGYTSLRGEITDISIDELATNSTYIYKLTFTDSYGTKVSVKTTDGVRTALSKYVNSSNFVVGKGSVETTKTEFVTVTPDDLNVAASDGVYSVNEESAVNVMTHNGNAEAEIKNSYVLTGKGRISLSGSTAFTENITLYAENPNNFIFSGKGWGHGVGLSQWGVKDLANLGYEAIEILGKYFTGIEILDWHKLI